MHTVEILEHAMGLLARLRYKIRPEWLGGAGGGGCEVGGRKIFFLDLAQGPADQLDRALDTLRREPGAAGLPMPHELRELLALRKSA